MEKHPFNKRTKKPKNNAHEGFLVIRLNELFLMNDCNRKWNEINSVWTIEKNERTGLFTKMNERNEKNSKAPISIIIPVWISTWVCLGPQSLEKTNKLKFFFSKLYFCKKNGHPKNGSVFWKQEVQNQSKF